MAVGFSRGAAEARSGDNPFASLTDAQRRHIRAIQEKTGCFECAHLVVVRGRNSNSYGCRQRTGCESLTRTLAIYKLVVEGLSHD